MPLSPSATWSSVFFDQSTFAVAEADGRIGAMALHFRGITPSRL